MQNNPHIDFREGTSQNQRFLAALRATYVQIDERTIADWIRFAQAYAKELKFFNLEDQEEGTWENFLQGDAEEMAAFLKNPEAFKDQPGKLQLFSRPHVVLFLLFLEQLKEQYQKPINQLSKRHLDFYYQDVLRFKPKSARQDEVYLLLELAQNFDGDRLPIPKDTTFLGGKDKAGKDLVYAASRNSTISTTQLRQVKTVFVNRTTTTIEDYDFPRDLRDMLRLVIGEDQDQKLVPGGSLPLINVLGYNAPPDEAFWDNQLKSFITFRDKMLRFPAGNVNPYLALSYASIRQVARLKQQRDASDNQWREINGVLNSMKNPNRVGVTSRDFIQNFANATGLDPVDSDTFGAFQDVDNIYEFFDEYQRLKAQENPIQTELDQFEGFIEEGFFGGDAENPTPSNLESFERMMQLRLQIRSEWERLQQILFTSLGNNKPLALESPQFKMIIETALEVDDLETFFRNAHPDISSFRSYVDTIDVLERYFGMLIEELELLVKLKSKQTLSDSERAQVTGIFGKAHRKKSAFLREEETHAKMGQEFDEMFRLAFGSPRAGDPYPLYSEGGRAFTLDELYDKIKEKLEEEILPERSQYIKETLSLTVQDFKYVMAVKASSAELTDRLSKSEFYRLAKILNLYDFEFSLRQALGRPNSGDPYPVLIENGVSYSLDLLFDEIRDTSEDQVFAQKRDYIEGQLGLEIADFIFILSTKQDYVDSNGDLTKRVAPWKLNRVTQLLEKAERRIRNIQLLPDPQITVLKSVHASTDATQDLVDPNPEFPSWRTFGSTDLEEASLGLAISSPLLRLAEGIRSIIITLDLVSLTATQQDYLNNNYASFKPFTVEVTTEKEWYVVPYELIKRDENLPASIKLKITLQVDEEAIAPLPADAPERIDEEAGIRIKLASSRWYSFFGALSLRSVDLKVSAEAINPSQLANNESILDPGKAFEPFGLTPKVGSKLYFSHPELAAKPLTTLELNAAWIEKPDFSENTNLYSEYDEKYRTEGNYRFNASAIDQGKEVDLGNSLPLFNREALTITFDATLISALDNAYATPNSEDGVVGSTRYFVLELSPQNFGHTDYPRLLEKKAKELTVAAVTNRVTDGSGQTYVINPPYTPRLQDFRITYSSEIKHIGLPSFGGPARLYHLHPFGYQTLSGSNKNLLPNYEAEGTLFLGFEQLPSPLDLSLLFQMAEGSTNPDTVPDPVDWSFLQNGLWQELPKENWLRDGTNGLKSSGIIELRLPKLEVSDGAVLPKGLSWLRASVAKNTGGILDTIGIHPNALHAKLDSVEYQEDHFRQPLPSESIDQLQQTDGNIQAVSQPYSSFGGQAPEPNGQLNARVSERLRHKNRAINLWDYERIVLEAFPEVFKVKCLTVDAFEDSLLGRVTLIVVPNVKGLRPYDPFQPKLPISKLEEIKAYLEALAPPQVEIVVQNPVYVPLEVRVWVSLYPQYKANEAFYLNELDLSLQRYLAPWAFEKAAEVPIGSPIYPNQIVNFIEQQEAVDYIIRMNIAYKEDGIVRNACRAEYENGLQLSRPDYVWGSIMGHRVSTEIVSDIVFGIGCMRVSNPLTYREPDDFIVG